MDFQDELKAAADKCAEDQRNSMDHQVRQAFFAGISWYMAYLRKKNNTPPSES